MRNGMWVMESVPEKSRSSARAGFDPSSTAQTMANAAATDDQRDAHDIRVASAPRERSLMMAVILS